MYSRSYEDEEEQEQEEDRTSSEKEEAEYEFEGFEIQFSKKIMLTPASVEPKKG